MRISYKRTYKESYMIMEQKEPAFCYEDKMIKENEIKSLLTFYTMEINGKMQYWHDISGKQSLQEYMVQEGISYELLEKIMTHFVIAIEELHKYLIREENVLILPETVYINRQGGFGFYLCYFPKGEKNGAMFSEVMEYILSLLSEEEEQLVQLCYQLYEQALCQETTVYDLLSLVQLQMPKKKEQEVTMEEIWELEEEKEDLEEDVFLPGNGWEKLAEDMAKKGQKLIQMVSRWNKKKTEPEKREDFMLEPQPEEKTYTQQLFQGKKVSKGQLLYQGSGEEKDFIVTKKTVRIGHKEHANDICLQSAAVSGYHAKISKEKDGFYLEDLNSTNGTYINGTQLNYMEKKKLEYMDEVQFADVCYLFV